MFKWNTQSAFSAIGRRQTHRYQLLTFFEIHIDFIALHHIHGKTLNVQRDGVLIAAVSGWQLIVTFISLDSKKAMGLCITFSKGVNLHRERDYQGMTSEGGFDPP